jgi:hypothetical protein
MSRRGGPLLDSGGKVGFVYPKGGEGGFVLDDAYGNVSIAVAAVHDITFWRGG